MARLSVGETQVIVWISYSLTQADSARPGKAASEDDDDNLPNVYELSAREVVVRVWLIRPLKS